MAKRDIFKDLSLIPNVSKSNGKALCPVCDMMVSKKSYFTSSSKGKKYYFCCDDCKSSFDKNPYKFVLS